MMEPTKARRISRASTGSLKGQRLNPLNSSNILRHLFTFFSVEDLKATRLVCHAWHCDATAELSIRIHPILLHDKVDWKKFLKTFSKSCTSPKMSKLAFVHPFHAFAFLGTYPEDPAATPYKTAILDYMHSKYRYPKKTLWDTRFFSTYGAQITELKFVQFNLYSEKALRELRDLLSTSCPELATLTIQFQKEVGGSGSGSSSTPTPSPSPSPHMVPGNENVFFPTETSPGRRRTLAKLKKFTFATDNKCYLNPYAVEEFMTLMPSLEEFTYRYTGAKKQWTLVRRVDIIDILCNILNAGHYGNIINLDLDSEGTVLSGEDFRKLSQLTFSRKELKLRKFACQVFIKTEPDWEYLCQFLSKIASHLESLDTQIRTHFPQLLSEQELPRCFPRVGRAKLLLDSNLKTFLKRMPRLTWFTGVYDNELLPLPESQSQVCKGYLSSGSSGSSQTFQQEDCTPLEESVGKMRLENDKKKENGAFGDEGTIVPNLSEFSSEYDYDESPFCPSATHLRIQGNDEFGLDIEWKARVFCNIQSFETDIYFDQDLRLIWVHLHGIRRLVLHLRTCIPEQAFTGAGVPPLTPNCWKGTSGQKDFQNLESLTRLEEYPNMGLLQRLETLEIYTGSRQDAYGSQFSGSLIVYGAALLKNLKRLVLPPAIPPKCLEESLRYLAKLKDLTYLSVCDDTFQCVLPFHMLKLDLSNLEIVVRYYQPEVKRIVGNYWRLERFVFPDFLPEHGRKVMDKRHSAPSLS